MPNLAKGARLELFWNSDQSFNAAKLKKIVFGSLWLGPNWGRSQLNHNWTFSHDDPSTSTAPFRRWNKVFYYGYFCCLKPQSFEALYKSKGWKCACSSSWTLDFTDEIELKQLKFWHVQSLNQSTRAHFFVLSFSSHHFFGIKKGLTKKEVIEKSNIRQRFWRAGRSPKLRENNHHSSVSCSIKSHLLSFTPIDLQ